MGEQRISRQIPAQPFTQIQSTKPIAIGCPSLGLRACPFLSWRAGTTCKRKRGHSRLVLNRHQKPRRESQSVVFFVTGTDQREREARIWCSIHTHRSLIGTGAYSPLFGLLRNKRKSNFKNIENLEKLHSLFYSK